MSDESERLKLSDDWLDRNIEAAKKSSYEYLQARNRLLEQQLSTAREALEPFAELAKHFTSAPEDGWIWRAEEPLEITVGHLRRAAAGIRSLGEKE